MSEISRAGRRELLTLIDWFDGASPDGRQHGSHSLRAAIISGTIQLRNPDLREAILHDPWAIEESLIAMSKANRTIDSSFILFALHVLFGWDTPHKRQRIEALAA
jgi:hypothetical protein